MSNAPQATDEPFDPHGLHVAEVDRVVHMTHDVHVAPADRNHHFVDPFFSLGDFDFHKFCNFNGGWSWVLSAP